MANISYGICTLCDAPLIPIRFVEDEYSASHIKTGRKRIAVSHLECSYCGKHYTVDDTFDGPWERS